MSQQNSFSQINLPLACSSTQQLGKCLDLNQLDSKIIQNYSEIDIPFNGNLHLVQQDTEKYIFKVKILRKKDDHSQKIKKFVYVGKLSKEYDCNELKDFHYRSVIDEKSLLSSIKLWPQEEKPDFLNSKLDPRIYSDLTKPLQFLKNYKQKHVDLFRDQQEVSQNQQQNQKEVGGKSKISYKCYQVKNDKNQQSYQIPTKSLSNPEQEILKTPLYHFLKKKFEERPVWLRNTIMFLIEDQFDYTINELKKILSLFSYNFKYGPWKFAYIRFGYDPFLYPEAIDYQVIDIAVQERDIPLNSSIYNQEMQVYDPSYSVMPANYRHLYQICDIKDVNVRKYFIKCKEMLEMSEKNRKVHQQSGWLDLTQWRRIQKIMKDKFRLDTEKQI